MIDLERLQKLSESKNRYQKRISQLQDDGIITNSIEESVEKSLKNIKGNISSFVIYGEPQSGKTELMIALTAKLLDEGNKNIVLLVNDNIQLLNQNLERFKKSGLDPSPHSFLEILDKSFTVSQDKELVVFCTKNAKNLNKLIEKIGSLQDKIIIDDEADYATPNSKINSKKQEITKINELVGKLIGKNGVFIGVTATPVRLDLNNTFGNQNINWVNFKPHPIYTGQEIFFPDVGDDIKYDLQLMPEFGDDPKHIKNALFHFMVNVAYLNTIDDGKEKNYSMLVHTSGKKSEHWKDYKDIINIFNNLSELNSKSLKLFNEIEYIAKNKFPGNEEDIIDYIVKNKDRKAIVVINSDADDNVNGATEPNTPFTIAIGGNIVSRGVTFNNLLCMFFTRDVKHKIQQDTYIQRARMFGARGKYLKYFMLFIPENLFKDWQRAFVYNRLSLESVKKGNGVIWFEDARISSTASSSIDKTNISLMSGEMSFGLFEYSNKLDDIIDNNNFTNIEKLERIKLEFGENAFPSYMLDFIIHTIKGDDSKILLLPPGNVINRSESYVDRENIITSKQSFLTELSKKEDNLAKLHWIRPYFFSGNNKARIFYRYNNARIKFLKNRKYDS